MRCLPASRRRRRRAADNKAIARRYFDEILNKGSAAAIDSIVAADVVFRNPPVVVKGIADFRKLVAALRERVSRSAFHTRRRACRGQKVATRWVMRGTQGTRKVDVSGMDIFLIENGKIREIWVNMDTLAQARQMGTVRRAMKKVLSALPVVVVDTLLRTQPRSPRRSPTARSRVRFSKSSSRFRPRRPTARRARRRRLPPGSSPRGFRKKTCTSSPPMRTSPMWSRAFGGGTRALVASC